MNLVPSGMTEQEMKKAQEGVEVLPPTRSTGSEEYTGPVFKTLIKNNRRCGVMVLHDRGSNWLSIPPGGEEEVLAWSDRALYAPFSKITFERAPRRDKRLDEAENDDKYGKVSAVRRFGFKAPVETAAYHILLDNVAGSPLEVIHINDEPVSVIRGIPIRVAVPLRDRLVIYKAVRWIERTVKEPAPGRRDYLITRQIVEKVTVPRKASEIRAIRRFLEKEAVDEARRMASEKYGYVVGGDDEEVTSDAEVQGDQQ